MSLQLWQLRLQLRLQLWLRRSFPGRWTAAEIADDNRRGAEHHRRIQELNE